MPASSSWAFCQVGLMNSVVEGRRTAKMASRRVSMAGPSVRSGVRPAYLAFIFFLNFAQGLTNRSGRDCCKIGSAQATALQQGDWER